MSRCHALLLPFLALASCTWLGEGTPPAPPAGEHRADESYLNAGSPTRIDIAPGQSNLLEAVREEKDKVERLRVELEQIKQEQQRLHVQLADAEQERDREHAGRVAAEAQHRAASEKLRDREARILNLALEKAKLEQEILALKITSLEKRLAEQQRKEAATSAAPPR